MEKTNEVRLDLVPTIDAMAKEAGYNDISFEALERILRKFKYTLIKHGYDILDDKQSASSYVLVKPEDVGDVETTCYEIVDDVMKNIAGKQYTLPTYKRRSGGNTGVKKSGPTREAALVKESHSPEDKVVNGIKFEVMPGLDTAVLAVRDAAIEYFTVQNNYSSKHIKVVHCYEDYIEVNPDYGSDIDPGYYRIALNKASSRNKEGSVVSIPGDYVLVPLKKNESIEEAHSVTEDELDRWFEEDLIIEQDSTLYDVLNEIDPESARKFNELDDEDQEEDFDTIYELENYLTSAWHKLDAEKKKSIYYKYNVELDESQGNLNDLMEEQRLLDLIEEFEAMSFDEKIEEFGYGWENYLDSLYDDLEEIKNNNKLEESKHLNEYFNWSEVDEHLEEIKSGATIENGKLATYTYGYQVATKDSQEVLLKDLEEVKEFVKEQGLTSFGIWFDGKNYVLDTDVVYVEELEDAVKIAKEANQKAIFAWDILESIYIKDLEMTKQYKIAAGSMDAVLFTLKKKHGDGQWRQIGKINKALPYTNDDYYIIEAPDTKEYAWLDMYKPVTVSYF